MTSPDTLLVIPSYRDGARLAEFLPGLCAALSGFAGGVRVQVVDDGSPPAEQLWLAAEVDRVRRIYDFVHPLLAQAVNGGKGSAIRAGWATVGSMRWLAFVDADGAAPATEVVALIERARNSGGAPALFIAVRTNQIVKPVRRFWYRQFGSRLFSGWVRRCLGLKLSDTQCGLKVMPASFVSETAWRENGFAFDLELLLRARAIDLPIFTQPIAWTEQAGSSLGPGAMLGLFAAVWRLCRFKSGISSSPAVHRLSGFSAPRPPR